MIPDGLARLAERMAELCRDNELMFDRMSGFSTPRRLTVILTGLPDRQPDRVDSVSGPPESVAFDSQGNPTAAAQGFARKMGLAVEELTMEETDRGRYLCARRRKEGQAAPAILVAGLPRVISELNWPKNMYWTASQFRFIRPLRWFVCLWNETVLPFQFEGVEAGGVSRGHRSLGREEVEVRHPDEYVEVLRGEFVLVDEGERRKKIEKELGEQLPKDCRLLEDDRLMETVVHLNEFPAVIRGGFDARFLKIPREVLVMVMRHHQKYFAVTHADGTLAPWFLTVLNTREDPDGRIRRGHERVLKARLEDAAFFWEADQSVSLLDRAEGLQQVIFQEKLGSYLDKTRRLENLCEFLLPDSELKTAARLCKADLTTEMVRELPELQGTMGGLYARQEGYPEAVWKAIYEHYLPASVHDPCPSARQGALLSLADRLDTIVGCFGAGIIPTGSSDPFALRRQAQGMVRIALEHQVETPLAELTSFAAEQFPEGLLEPGVVGRVMEFLANRLRFALQSEGIEYDVINAVLSGPVDSIPRTRERARALSRIKGEEDLEAVAAAFKRTKNILEKQQREEDSVRQELLQEAEERALFSAVQDLEESLQRALEKKDYDRALREIAKIREPVDRFFDAVLVMCPDESLRRNRLALLRRLAGLFLKFGDISEIVQHGERQGENNA